MYFVYILHTKMNNTKLDLVMINYERNYISTWMNMEPPCRLWWR